MKNFLIQEVKTFLDKLKIKNVVDKSGQIKINRDSIVNVVKAVFEEDSYDRLKFRLNDFCGKRFFYSMKDDNWLWLEVIEER